MLHHLVGSTLVGSTLVESLWWNPLWWDPSHQPPLVEKAEVLRKISTELSSANIPKYPPSHHQQIFQNLTTFLFVNVIFHEEADARTAR
jgi:hypothetical protein